MTDDIWTYRAQLIDVIDGDTQDVLVDVGFRMQRKIRLRLQDVDTHETYGVRKESKEYQRGKHETQFVKDWFDEAEGEWPFIVRTESKGKFGRYLATVERRSDGAVLNEDLVETFPDVAVE